ncbi:MAG TPA: lipoyl(octanoyl) transferase [Bacteroidetes bacterium]|nr:lipoyl(octanoyl) transferase [Bacteroidota bacterium]
MNTIRAINLGRTDYKECWDLQQRLLEQRIAGEVEDLLLLTQHNHVYTIGKSGDDNHLLASKDELKSRGVAVYHNDRGGDITYHGPGQLVGYPILDLNNYYLDLHRYLRDIEEVIIRTLVSYGVKGVRDPKHTGVWVGNDKICAIGVKTSRWVTMHGFALNVNTDLTYFSQIVPCGISGKGVTSLALVVGHEIDMNEVSLRLAESFGEVFNAVVSSSDQEAARIRTSVQAEVIA